MEASTRVTTTLRIDKEILDIIKSKAKAANRSLNNYIECILINNAEEDSEELLIERLKAAEKKIKEGAGLQMKTNENLDDFLVRYKKEKGI